MRAPRAAAAASALWLHLGCVAAASAFLLPSSPSPSAWPSSTVAVVGAQRGALSMAVGAEEQQQQQRRRRQSARRAVVGAGLDRKGALAQVINRPSKKRPKAQLPYPN